MIGARYRLETEGEDTATANRSFATLRMTRGAVESYGILRAVAVRGICFSVIFFTAVILSEVEGSIGKSGIYAKLTRKPVEPDYRLPTTDY